MSDYVKSTNFTSKDSLASGNPLKIVKGAEIDTEFNNIAIAVATKTDNSNALITGGSITGITDLAVADGGTGASTATNARANLSAAQSGANSDITSLSGLTTALSVAQGGTGTSTLTANNVILGNGTSAVQTVAPGTSGNVLVSNGTTWTSGSAGVTSAVAGNGIAVSSSTGAVTFSVASPSYGSIGSYALIGFNADNVVSDCRGGTTSGSNFYTWNDTSNVWVNTGLSGTWKIMAACITVTRSGSNWANSFDRTYPYLAVRIS